MVTTKMDLKTVMSELVLNEKRCGVSAGGIDVKIFEEYLSGIKWGDFINDTLLEKVIKFKREEKSNCTSFWRK